MIEEILRELEENGYSIPEEDSPGWDTLVEAIDLAYKEGKRWR